SRAAQQPAGRAGICALRAAVLHGRRGSRVERAGADVRARGELNTQTARHSYPLPRAAGEGRGGGQSYVFSSSEAQQLRPRANPAPSLTVESHEVVPGEP